MRLRKIISGGQTGADQAGLLAGQRLGLELGGTAPKNYRTEAGCEREYLKKFGLVESPYYDYAPRTRQNVQDADVTLWFGNIGSPGYWCTSKACDTYSKTLYINPDADAMRRIADTYEIINVAGNRFSKNPQVVDLVTKAFSIL